MLFFLVQVVLLIALTNQWTLFVLYAANYQKVDSCPSPYPHSYHNTETCTVHNSFHGLDATPEDNLMVAVGHKTQKTGHKIRKIGCMTHNIGCMTHNTPSFVTHNTTGPATHYTSNMTSVEHFYHLNPGCTTCHPISISHRLHQDVSTGYDMTNKSSYLLSRCRCIVILYMLCRYRCLALPLGLDLLAINHYIYYYWSTLLLSGLLRSPYLSLWFLITSCLRIHIIAWKLLWFKILSCSQNLINLYSLKLMIDKTIVQFSHLCFIFFWIPIKLIISFVIFQHY